MGTLKKVFMACLIAAGYLMAFPGAAEFGPACTWPFKPIRWLGPTFFNAFNTLCSRGMFNNYGNAGFW